MKMHSLRARLTLWYTVTLVAVLVLFGVDVLVAQQRLGLRRADRELETVRETLANLFREELRELDDPATAAAEASSAIASLGDAVAILDARGAPLAVKAAGLPAADLIAGEGTSSVRTIRTRRGAWRVRAAPERFGDVDVTLVVARPLADVAREQNEVREAMLVAIPLALLLAGAGGWWLASIGLRPVREMARRAASVPLSGL